MKIYNVEITDKSDCFVIAEIGNNHGGDFDTAKKMIDAAIASGANAVKFQKRSNKDLFTKEMYNKPYDNENSYGKTYGEHREALEFNLKQYKELRMYTEGKGCIFFATPFDIESVKFLEEVGVPAYKVASALITDIPLLIEIAKTGKPVFVSTGTVFIEDVDRAYEVFKQYKVDVCLLHSRFYA
jgi:N-acetylneuraminate synthase/sialic acid synthase